MFEEFYTFVAFSSFAVHYVETHIQHLDSPRTDLISWKHCSHCLCDIRERKIRVIRQYVTFTEIVADAAGKTKNGRRYNFFCTATLSSELHARGSFRFVSHSEVKHCYRVTMKYRFVYEIPPCRIRLFFSHSELVTGNPPLYDVNTRKSNTTQFCQSCGGIESIRPCPRVNTENPEMPVWMITPGSVLAKF